jgi:hypothetical protein
VLHTEERSVRIATADGFTVAGVVRVRRVSLRRRAVSLRFEQQHPVAVVVERAGHTERIPLKDGGAATMPLAWLAMPVAAGIATRILRSSRKKGA